MISRTILFIQKIILLHKIKNLPPKNSINLMISFIIIVSPTINCIYNTYIRDALF